MRGSILPLVLIGFIVLTFLVATVLYFSGPATTREPEVIACTQETLLCPDGTAVGRVGPKCEFAKCPDVPVLSAPEVPASDDTFTIGETQTLEGVVITPLEILEDSRCPTDVVCIQAGTIRLNTRLTHGAVEETLILILGTPATFAEKKIVLTDVTPYPTAGEEILGAAYNFVFEVSPEERPILQ